MNIKCCTLAVLAMSASIASAQWGTSAFMNTPADMALSCSLLEVGGGKLDSVML